MKKVNKYGLLFFILIIITPPIFAQQSELNYSIAPWKDNKKAAVSITLDDAIKGQFTYAVPLLKKYDIRATLFISITIMQQQGITWDMVRTAAADGNEIANHTYSHPHVHALTADSNAYQLIACTQAIQQNIASQKSETHAYPFGDGGNENDSERAVRAVVSQYFIGARAVRNNKLAYNTYDFAKTSDNYYKVNSDMIADSATMADMPLRLDETIAAGGWYVPTYHGIEDGWIITPKAVFEKHLHEYNKRKNVLWIAPFADVIKYHKERNCAALQVVNIKGNRVTLQLKDTLTDETKWNMPLTINLHEPTWKVKSITQGGKPVPFMATSDAIIFDALPCSKNIEIIKD